MTAMASSISLSRFNVAVDRDLVASAIAGHEGGFEELVRRYQRPISAYVYRMVGDYDCALDLTQEIFIKIYASLSRYRPEFKFSTWIYKIAHNAAIDHLRRNAGRERSINNGTESEPQQLTIESKGPSPEQQSEREESRMEIESVVCSLPTAYRELIVLRHSQNLTYEEIVEVTGLPLGTVKNRLFRAREMMRQQFLL